MLEKGGKVIYRVSVGKMFRNYPKTASRLVFNGGEGADLGM